MINHIYKLIQNLRLEGKITPTQIITIYLEKRLLLEILKTKNTIPEKLNFMLGAELSPEFVKISDYYSNKIIFFNRLIY